MFIWFFCKVFWSKNENFEVGFAWTANGIRILLCVLSICVYLWFFWPQIMDHLFEYYV